MSIFNKKEKTKPPKKSYVEFEKNDLFGIMTRTGATVNSDTVDEVHKYMQKHTNYLIENMEEVIKNWKREGK